MADQDSNSTWCCERISLSSWGGETRHLSRFQNLEYFIGIDNHYPVVAAKRAAALASRCLSHHPKCRPAMNEVVKTLENVLELNDFQDGSFVYIVPKEGSDQLSVKREKGEETDDGKEKDQDNDNSSNGGEEKVEVEVVVKKKENGRRREPERKGHRHKHRIRSMRSRAVYSDTALYKNFKKGSNSPLLPQPKENGGVKLLNC
ncbi:hypothetical protein Ccrd_015801 [Cynara cardunculus var. scolymus]|uniref:Uncharacterized protein n=1 Tax=Cynara cardunculus var. scolymus TaxID=59895 RepID=A0A118K3E6_CYNCS|nr:hypothetical protein Ccrd_015801 [Cynara cardunculus var. scolymus]